MGNMRTWGVAIISVVLLLASPMIAADLVFAWDNGQHTGSTLLLVSDHGDKAPSYQYAYDNRSMRQYHYFPSVCVYHDADRGLYFFPRGHEWRIAVSLPGELRGRLKDYVTFEMDNDKPYIFNDQHKKQYPPTPN